MPKRTDPHEGTVEGLTLTQKFAYGLIFTMLGMAGAGALFSRHFQSLFLSPESGAQGFLHVTQFLLLAIWVLLVALWIGATISEFKLWQRHLLVVVPDIDAYVAMIILAIALGIMPILIVYDARWFTGYYAVFLALNLWSQWVTNKHFALALASTRKKLGRPSTRRNQVRVLDAMEVYWLKRPQLGRIAVMAAMATGAFALALYAGTRAGSMQDALGATSLLLAFLVVLGGEVVINSWRTVRTREVRAALG